MLQFHLNGNQIQLLPKGWKDILIELTFEDEKQARLSVEKFEFGKLNEIDNQYDAIEILNDWLTNESIFKGVPFDIKLKCDTLQTVYKGLVDLSAESAQFSCDRIIAPTRELKGQDYLEELADSFSFAYLANGISAGSAGKINNSDYIDVWYQAGKYPEGAEILVAALTLYAIYKEIYEVIKRISDAVASIVGGVTGVAESVLLIAALVVYLIALIIALIKLTEDLVNYIFPFVYYHRAMLTRVSIQKACDYMGIGFSSTIFNDTTSQYYNHYLQPPKNVEGKKVGQASTEVGYYIGTFGQMLEGLKEQFNLQPRVINGILYVEREDFYQNLSGYTIPDMEVEFTGYNASEVPSNYSVEYQNDNADLYSYEDFTGISIQATTVLSTQVTQEDNMLKGFTRRLIPYSLVNVKTSESRLEQIMSDIYIGVSSLVNAISVLSIGQTLPNFPVVPSNSTNILKVDTHFTGAIKCGIYMGSGRTNPQSNVTLGAKNLFKEFHTPRIGKGIYGDQGNQWKTYKSYDVPLCCEDFQTLKDNNYVIYKGKQAKVLSCKWSPYDETAELEFRVRETYEPNLTVKLVYDGGYSGTATI